MAENHDEQTLLDLEHSTKPQEPVDCLGMTFENDEKRREYFLEKLREKLKDPEFRKIEGFPIGEDEDILSAIRSAVLHRMSESVYRGILLSIMGNPIIQRRMIIGEKPFAADVSEGSHTIPFTTHTTYHTKVPPQGHSCAISSSITPNRATSYSTDSVGTGMTGCGGADVW